MKLTMVFIEGQNKSYISGAKVNDIAKTCVQTWQAAGCGEVSSKDQTFEQTQQIIIRGRAVAVVSCQ